MTGIRGWVGGYWGGFGFEFRERYYVGEAKKDAAISKTFHPRFTMEKVRRRWAQYGGGCLEGPLRRGHLKTHFTQIYHGKR